MPVTYHGDDDLYDYNPQENIDRVCYYPPHPDGHYYTPYAWIDGIIRGGYDYEVWWDLIEDRSMTESPLTISLSGVFGQADRAGTLDINITAEAPVNLRQLQLRIALTEDSVYYHAPNGTDWHNFTMRDMIPDADGKSIEIREGEQLNLHQGFSCPEPLRIDYCRLVVWVQSDDDRLEILQTAAIKLTDMADVSVNNSPGIPESFDLAQNYPNPFNARTTISYTVDSENAVELTVYDITGRIVATLIDENQQPGEYQVIWDGTDQRGQPIASGMYFYKLQTGNKAESRRMLLLK